jgi:uncharacterized protein with PQ loop repeat
MELTTLALVVIAANVLGAAMAVPQARKLLRTRRTDGVSVTWAAISVTVNAWWGVYGIGVDDVHSRLDRSPFGATGRPLPNPFGGRGDPTGSLLGRDTRALLHPTDRRRPSG